MRIAPERLTITPAPRLAPLPFEERRFASISTMDGRICRYTVADAGGLDSSFSIAFPVTSEAIVPTSALSSGGGDVSRMAR